MQYIKYKSRGSAVSFLQEVLGKLGYIVNSSGYFDLATDQAVREFQKKHQLVVDGEVGIKTWTILLDVAKPFLAFGDKFLGEQDLINFAQEYSLELAVVKAVNEVESSGKGFLINGKPKILFEGHVFWRQLMEKGFDPNSFSEPENENILYKGWTKKHYTSGTQEYERLEKAMQIGPDPKIKEAALASASWGCFQIMGYHALPLGYGSVSNFVDQMYIHERNHLQAFGKYIEKYGCLKHLQVKDWPKFAKCYNGSGFALNKYDSKLASAFDKFAI
ncbi:N-acetylmuramidase family protein [Algoriphagus aestuarii]|nr:N-acetylmuramidase family protein [Algoriphagus aestuarii]